jgi:hypothetical protein
MRKYTRVLVVFAGVIGSCGSIAGAAASPAGAAITGSAKFTLSGAGKGTLQEGSEGLCTNARGAGGDILGLTGSISNFPSSDTWSIVVSTPKAKNGTYAIGKSGSNGPFGQLTPAKKSATEFQNQAAILDASSGQFSFSGEKGTLDVTFGKGKKAITVKGSWNCAG